MILLATPGEFAQNFQTSVGAKILHLADHGLFAQGGLRHLSSWFMLFDSEMDNTFVPQFGIAWYMVTRKI